MDKNGGREYVYKKYAIKFNHRVVTQLSLYNETFNTADFDYKFIVILLIGVCKDNNISSGSIEKRAYELIHIIFKHRTSNDVNRMGNFACYIQKGILAAKQIHCQFKSKK